MKSIYNTTEEILQGIISGDIDSFVLVAKVVDSDGESHTAKICKMTAIDTGDLACILNGLKDMVELITSDTHERDDEDGDS